MKNKKPELIIISDDSNFENKSKSLQDSFKDFRAYRCQMKKIQLKNKKNGNEELRKKFLETAKSLIGTPYGRGYLKKHPEYTSNLFLDCCGLVRHAFNLLSEEFGFKLRNWNQAYQYDILPEEIPFEQMKPGDLIFYSGIFYPDRKLKPQLHNMTHVEIYLGEGEKTVGSRYSEGTVSIYDTYQFVSEKYYNIQYHFKSIDTWLKGIHKSFCDKHKWHEDLDNPENYSKYSIFYEEMQEDNT